MRWALVVMGVMLAGGCSNTVYFYETEKISFTAEGRPDASQPVSANLGVKQRVVAVVPPQDKEACKPQTRPVESRHDAVAMISYFNFKKTQGEKWFSDPITIQTALITGKAAKCLSTAEAQQAFRAFAQAGSMEQRTAAWTTLGTILDFLWREEVRADPQVQKILDRVEASARGILVDCSEFPECTWSEGKDGRPGQMTVRMVAVKSAGAGVHDMDRLLEYRGKLGESVNSLKHWSKSPSQAGYRIADTLPAGVKTDTESLMGRLAEQEESVKALDERLGQDRAVVDAVRYFTEQLSFRKAGK